MQNKPSKKTYYIGELSKKFNLSQRAIRFYEEMGLISPSRTSGGFRVYSECDVFVLKTILTLKELGMSICEIKSLFLPKSERSSFSMAALRLALSSRREGFSMKAREFANNVLKIDEILQTLSSCSCCVEDQGDANCKSCLDKRSSNGEELLPIIDPIIQTSEA